MQTKADDRDQIDDLWDEEEEETGRTTKYLLFRLGEELYGINIMNVTEIIEMQRITDVPDMPSYIRGVINLRGKVIPLMDLRRRFGMSDRDYDDRTCIIVTSIDQASLGLIVDTVAEVHDIPHDEVESAPSFSDSEKNHYVEGVGKLGDRITILIDARKILHGRELQAVTDQL